MGQHSRTVNAGGQEGQGTDSKQHADSQQTREDHEGGTGLVHSLGAREELWKVQETNPLRLEGASLLSTN